MNKPFSSITVYVEYRCGGGVVPQDRLLRARVSESVTPSGGVCRAYGDELVAPRKLTDRDIPGVHNICIQQLHHLTRRIVFRYDPLLDLLSEEYPVPDVA